MEAQIDFMTDAMMDFLTETYREYCFLNKLDCISADELAHALQPQHECYAKVKEFSDLWGALASPGEYNREELRERFCNLYMVLPIERSEINDAYYKNVGAEFSSYNKEAIYNEIVGSCFDFLVDDDSEGGDRGFPREFWHEDCGNDRQPFDIECNRDGIGMTDQMHSEEYIEKLLPEEKRDAEIVAAYNKAVEDAKGFEKELKEAESKIKDLRKMVSDLGGKDIFATKHFEALNFVLESWEREAKDSGQSATVGITDKRTIRAVCKWLKQIGIKEEERDVKYLVNQNGYYFAIEGTVDCVKANCVQFPSLVQMYEYVAKKHDLELDEVWGNEIFIDKEGHEYDFRGHKDPEPISTSIEDHIKTYVL